MASFNLVYQKTKIIPLILFIALILTVSGCKDSTAEKKIESLDKGTQAAYAKKSQLTCKDVNVVLTTNCVSENGRNVPDCQKQQFSFGNLKTGQIRIVEASGKLMIRDAATAKATIDGLASSWACIKGHADSYVVVGYYNGGNCEQCEWYEIYSKEGQALTPNARTDKISFTKAAEQLGLNENWSKNLIDIPLK
jgi:hypothetical protein